MKKQLYVPRLGLLSLASDSEASEAVDVIQLLLHLMVHDQVTYSEFKGATTQVHLT